jgi:hypothetical protein
MQWRQIQTKKINKWVSRCARSDSWTRPKFPGRVINILLYDNHAPPPDHLWVIPTQHPSSKFPNVQTNPQHTPLQLRHSATTFLSSSVFFQWKQSKTECVWFTSSTSTYTTSDQILEKGKTDCTSKKKAETDHNIPSRPTCIHNSKRVARSPSLPFPGSRSTCTQKERIQDLQSRKHWSNIYNRPTHLLTLHIRVNEFRNACCLRDCLTTQLSRSED